ncbi:MAG TPA: hypothetical protein VF287_08625 [Usitatibacter sp.]
MSEWTETMAAYRTAAVAALCALGVATEASAQLFKCKGPDGKIVYSDKACEADATRAAVPVGVSNRAHAIEEKAASDRAATAKEEADARLQAEARAAAEAKYGVGAGKAPAPAPAAPEASSTRSGSVGGPQPYQLTYGDRERIRNLEIDAGRIGLSAEQKSASQLEIQSIRGGTDARMSSADRERRDSLKADLVSTDAKKRAQSMRDLRDFYNR